MSHILELDNKRSIMNKDPKLNQVFTISKKGMWTNETLKTILDVIKRGTFVKEDHQVMEHSLELIF